MNIIKVEGINKKFSRKKALEDINIEISGTYGLLGPNGAGKTTLMRIIATLLTPNSGSISYKNLNWSNHNKIRQIIGYLPQHFSIYPTISVYKCLDHLAILKGIRDKRIREEVIETLLKETNLLDARDKKVNQLSGGMLRRVGIAQALLGNPEIVIIDEPTAGLDIEERVRFRNLLRKIGKHKIVIISTHIVEDLEYTCDNICVLKNSKVLAQGTRQEIANKASDHVWEAEIEDSPEKMDYINKKFHVISTKKSHSHKYILRILSNVKPLDNAIKVMPNLEDGYLYLMNDGNVYNE